MKMKNLFVLAAATLMLVACGEKPTSKETPVSTEAPVSETVSSEAPATSVADSKAPATSAPTSAAPATSATPATSANPSTSTATSTSTAGQATRYELNFRNTMQGADKNKVGERVQNYINAETVDGFCTGVTNEGSNQVASIDDSVLGTFTTLQIGSSSGEGALTFTFSTTVKSIILSLENYNKNYSNNGTPGTSQDTSTKIYVDKDANVVDLAATAGNPVTKTAEFEINAKSFKIYNKAGKNRAFVNGITFVL